MNIDEKIAYLKQRQKAFTNIKTWCHQSYREDCEKYVKLLEREIAMLNEMKAKQNFLDGD